MSKNSFSRIVLGQNGCLILAFFVLVYGNEGGTELSAEIARWADTQKVRSRDEKGGKVILFCPFPFWSLLWQCCASSLLWRIFGGRRRSFSLQQQRRSLDSIRTVIYQIILGFIKQEDIFALLCVKLLFFSIKKILFGEFFTAEDRMRAQEKEERKERGLFLSFSLFFFPSPPPF